jgi:hypothetical protein
MGHLSRSRRAFLSDEPRLLLLLPIAHRSEVSKHRHESRVISVEGLSTTMRHDEDRATRFFSLPWKKDAVSYQRCFDTEDLEKSLRDREVLGMPSLQTKPTSTGITWQNRVQESRVVPSRRDPVVELLVASVFFLDAVPALSAPQRSTAALTSSCRMASGFSSSAWDSRCSPAI